MFVLAHPDDSSVCARYGYNELGPWAEVFYGGAAVRYDRAGEGYDADDPIRGLLRFLVEFGYLAPTDIADARMLLAGRNSHDETFRSGPLGSPGRRRLRRGVRAVLRVIQDLELAAG